MRSAARRCLAGAVILIALAAGASSATARVADRYPPAFERAFLSSCDRTSGGMAGVCRCELRWLEVRYTYRRLVTIYLHDKGRMRRIIVRAALACTR